MAKKVKISVIIKALNEEENIERSIKSSLEATKGLSSEVILADSLSTDKTIALAKRYPVRIVQLKDPRDRACGVGPQLGYQHAKGEYLYILDADMEFEKGFLKKAVEALDEDSSLAGVAGQTKEMRAVNIVFRRREAARKEAKELDKLEMGGLYRRKALESVGYFSNRNLHAYEEAELGYRLVKNGWRLVRLPIPGIRHYGYDTTSFGVFKRRWKTRYVKGSGEFLRSALGKGFFFRAAWHLKIYLFLMAWWAALILLLLFAGRAVLKAFLLLSGIILLAFLIKKKSLTQWAFSLISWHYSMVGLVWGFFSRQKDPKGKISSRVIR